MQYQNLLLISLQFERTKGSNCLPFGVQIMRNSWMSADIELKMPPLLGLNHLRKDHIRVKNCSLVYFDDMIIYTRYYGNDNIKEKEFS